MKCPSCGSENTQRLQVVYEQGTQNISTTSSSLGGGFGGGFGAGAAHTKTEGTSQSAMASKASPPEKKKLTLFVVLLIVGMLCFNGTAGVIIFGIVILAVSIFAIKNALKYNKEIWPSLYKEWTESWVCNKCGTFYHQPIN